jgi:hypothetical protein
MCMDGEHPGKCPATTRRRTRLVSEFGDNIGLLCAPLIARAVTILTITSFTSLNITLCTSALAHILLVVGMSCNPDRRVV